jgi:flavin-dependent dehydrogenase
MADLAEALRADEYLRELGDDDLAALAGAMEAQEVADGGILVGGDEPGNALLLVLSGEVEAGGTGAETRRLGPGSWLGGFAGIDVGPGVAIAKAAGPVSVGRFPQAAYGALHESRPALRVALALSLGSQLARDFRDVSRRVRERTAPVTVAAEAAEREYDVVVIGAGPHAIAYAVWIMQERPETRVALVEKRRSPGFKIGESTLGPVVRAAMSMGVPLPVLRRLFNNKLGLHFWWMGEDSPDLHMHVDHVVEETFQLERRVWETMMLSVARRAGIDVYQDTKVLIDESRIEGRPKELVCVTSGGDVLRLRATVVCDASGPAALIGRHLGIRRKNADFNTNAYFGYFMKKSEVDLPTWDVAATRHLCFREGWIWFIELASWERASDENLQAMVDHLLDIRSPDEDAYPSRYELSESFGAPLDQWPISIGVVPRTDIDTAADLPLEERFQHYVNRYPVFKRIMDTYELIEKPYEGLPTYISYLDLTQYSDRYAGDGWLLLGDAAFFVNPLYSPGMTYGHSMASFAARETVAALERGDVSEQAFAAYDQGARGMFSALVSECEMWYRSFRHMDAYERGLMLRVAFFIGLAHPRIAQLGGIQAMRRMVPIRPPGPPGEPIMHPRYNQLLRQLIDTMRDLEARNADPSETAKAVKAIVDPVVDEIGGMEGVAALHLQDAMQYYDDRLQRVPQKQDWPSLVPTWRCANCDNRNPLEFGACYVCGDPPPVGTRLAEAAAAGPPR